MSNKRYRRQFANTSISQLKKSMEKADVKSIFLKDESI